MDKPLRLLCIGAHPADVFDQSGGTMATTPGAATMSPASWSRTAPGSTTP